MESERQITMDNPHLLRLVSAANAVLNFKGSLENDLGPLDELEEAVAPFLIAEVMRAQKDLAS